MPYRDGLLGLSCPRADGAPCIVRDKARRKITSGRALRLRLFAGVRRPADLAARSALLD